MHKEKIVIVGLGYVGLPLALLAEKKGYQIIGIVKNKEKAESINIRKMPFFDKGLEAFLKKSKIEVSTDFREIKQGSIIIICVPTPIDKNNNPDLKALIEVSEKIGKNLKKDQLVILESTVNPGISDEIVIPLIEKNSKLKMGKDFSYAHCPERINPGDKKWTVGNIPRVVGGIDKKSIQGASKFYKSILKGKVTEVSSVKEAEAVKIVENTFRDINIAFVNELAISFSHLGIDVVKVINAASTKPFSFMAHYPGCGVGGHCIPVDPYYLINYAKDKGFKHDFLMLARKINNYMPKFTVDLAKKLLKVKNIPIKGARILVLGLSYKANIDDTRESPSYKIITLLERLGARVKTYDPYVKSETKSLSDALKKIDAIILATDHDEFRKITPHDLLENNISILVDGRNALDKETFVDAGILYRGIGR